MEHVDSQHVTGEDGYPQSRYNPQAPPSAGWMANRASGSAQLGATKRPSLASHDRDGSAKKFKADVALPPKMGEFWEFRMGIILN